MAMMRPCDCDGRLTPVYRLASVILDGHIAELCPRCLATEADRIEVPYAPRTDQKAIQPSTTREVW